MPSSWLKIGDQYTRAEVQRRLNIAPARGGPWYTGYIRHGQAFYLFCNVGVAGRTGHAYGNRWRGGDLEWFAKGSARPAHNEIRSLLSGRYAVHIFVRDQNRRPFTYVGEGAVKSSEMDLRPIKVLWAISP